MTHSFQRALVTGITGSGGSYLAEHILDHCPGTQVHGISRWHSTSSNSNIESFKNRATFHSCDLNDLSSVYRVVKSVNPDVIFHIASHANVRDSFDNPLAVMENNIRGTANLFEAVKMNELSPVIQLCSTSEVYGQVEPHEVPIKESNAIRPSSPYAVSKVTQDLLGLTYFKSYGMRIIRTRMFAYLNPRRADLFATAFALQIAKIEAGLQETLFHGNLDSVRTFVDVRDAMSAYWLAALHGEPGEAYNIGGTTTMKVGDFLDLLKKHAKKSIPSEVDPKLLRPSDVTLQIPDISKFVAKTQWKPVYSFEDSVKMLLDHCRKKVSNTL